MCQALHWVTEVKRATCQPSITQSDAGAPDFRSDNEFLGLSGWKARAGPSCSLADGGCPNGGRETLLAPDTITWTCESAACGLEAKDVRPSQPGRV